MKDAWGWLLLAACGTGTGGEPMQGDVAFTYGSSKPKMVVGSAVQSRNAPTQMIVQMGDDNVDCGTYLDSGITFIPSSGTFVYFTVDAANPGPLSNAYVSVEHSTGTNTKIDVASGMVMIDTVMPRVTGGLSFMDTDMTVGEISVAGNFDIKRCF
jgi:hypothetical protein